MSMRLHALVAGLLLCASALAEVSSETIFFLRPDGRHYLLERAVHSDSASHRFHLPKSVQPEDLLHISPAHYEWDDSGQDSNTLSFDAGGFSLIYPGVFSDRELQRDADGVWHFKSWDGRRDAQGRYGYWYAPGDFDRYTFTWIVPDNIELTRYRSNRQGTWTRRPHAVSFYAEKVNNLSFEIDYRVRPTAPGRTAPEHPGNATPKPAPTATAAPRPPRKDADHDGVDNVTDLCPETPTGARVDRSGCPLDNDRDGVPDGIDRCIATPEDTPVDAQGCARD